MKRMLFAALLPLGLCVLSTAQAQQRYAVTDLSSLTPDGFSVQWATVNNSGDLAGTNWNSVVGYIGGKFGTYQPIEYGSYYGPVIGNSGVLMFSGSYMLEAPRAYRVVNGTMSPLPVLSQDANSSFVNAINDAGVAVGYGGNDQITCTDHGGYYCYGQDRAVVYQNGTATSLGTLPGGDWSRATGINNHGAIVGVSGTESGQRRAFIYENGTMRDLNVGNVYWGDTILINDAGQIAGDSYNGHWLITNGVTEYFDRGSSSYLVDLNNAGQVIGHETVGGTQKAWIREDGKVTMLDDLLVEEGWNVVGVSDLNDLGQIVGRAISPDGRSVYVLLSPVPEPATYALLAGGLGLLALRRRQLWRAQQPA